LLDIKLSSFEKNTKNGIIKFIKFTGQKQTTNEKTIGNYPCP